MFEDFELIHSYTRAQAIGDGYLVDVSETAKEAGFRIPVALTRAVWEDCVEWGEEDTGRKGWPQDQSGRLWDVLYMAILAVRHSIRRGEPEGGRVPYQVLRVPRDGAGRRPRAVVLHVVIGGGDAGEPVITITQPGED